jgi:triacylglycerol lipase
MGRRTLSVLVGFGVSLTLLGLTGSPAGAAPAPNDPVLLVAGTFSPEWALDPLAARLRADGFQVFTMALPNGGTGDIAVTARSVDTKVDSIRAATGAARVSVVGHSQGGLAARYYLKYLGGHPEVGKYVSLGSPQYGTATASIGSFLGCLGIVACDQMAIGSAFVNNLNAGDDTPGTTKYTAVATLHDELVQPYWNAWLDGGSANVLVQAHCPLRIVGHVGLILDGAVYGLVRSALKGTTIRTNCFAL